MGGPKLALPTIALKDQESKACPPNPRPIGRIYREPNNDPGKTDRSQMNVKMSVFAHKLIPTYRRPFEGGDQKPAAKTLAKLAVAEGVKVVKHSKHFIRAPTTTVIGEYC